MKACVIFSPLRDSEKFAKIKTCISLLLFEGEEVILAPKYYRALFSEVPDSITKAQNEKHALTMADTIICLGGDGTVIYTVHAMEQAGVLQTPLAAINLGTVGFICPYSYKDITALYFKSKAHRIQKRSVLYHLHARGKVIALNEVLITKESALTTVITYTLSLNGETIGKFRADGVIISTATGSTAYNFSMNGPIISPMRDSGMVSITPIGCIDASVKPIVISLKTSDVIKVISNEPTLGLCDSREGVSGKTHLIGLNKEKISLLVPENFNYFKLLEEKLGWGRLSK